MVVMKRADHKFRDQWREADSAIEAPLQPFFFSIFSTLLSPFVLCISVLVFLYFVVVPLKLPSSHSSFPFELFNIIVTICIFCFCIGIICMQPDFKSDLSSPLSSPSFKSVGEPDFTFSLYGLMNL